MKNNGMELANNSLKKSSEEKLPEIMEEKISEKYSIISEGSMKYIINSEGKKVSNGYHDFTVFKHDNISGLIGSIGAIGKILKFPENEGDFFEEAPVSFHSIRFDNKIGSLVSKTGAMNYIVDMYTGEKISDGYHEFFMRGGKLFGKIGSQEKEVKLYNPPQIENTEQIEQ